MVHVTTALAHAMAIDGALGVALVDYESGTCLGTLGDGGLEFELAAAGFAELVRSQRVVRDTLGLHDKIEDILVTMDSQYHLIRIIQQGDDFRFFLCLMLNRHQANLALARLELARLGKNIQLPQSI